MNAPTATRDMTMEEQTLRHVCDVALDKIALTRAHWMAGCEGRPDTREKTPAGRARHFGGLAMAAQALSATDQVPFDLKTLLGSLDMARRQPPKGFFASRLKTQRFEMRERARERVEAAILLVHPGFDVAAAREGNPQEPAVIEALQQDFQTIRALAFEMRKPMITFMELEGSFTELAEIMRDFRSNLLEDSEVREIAAALNDNDMEHAF